MDNLGILNMVLAEVKDLKIIDDGEEIKGDELLAYVLDNPVLYNATQNAYFESVKQEKNAPSPNW